MRGIRDEEEDQDYRQSDDTEVKCLECGHDGPARINAQRESCCGKCGSAAVEETS